MFARAIGSGFALLLVASAAVAEDKNITILSNGVAVVTLSVPGDAKVTSSAEKTVVDTKELILYLWVVPKAKTVSKVVPKVAEVIKGEVKDFVVQRTNTMTVAGAEAKHLIGRGKEADGGKPASANSSMSRVPVRGDFSAGLRRNVLPQATAIDIIHSGIKAGKLNGGMPTTTPRGSRMAWQSTSREMSVRVCPISWEGMPQANSTTSSPRRSEPHASPSRLPFSRTMLCATSETFFSSRSRNLNST